MNEDLRTAISTISKHCRAHYRVNARCRGCQMTAWCEDRDGFPKDFASRLEEKERK